MRDHYQQHEQVLAQAMAYRLEWEHATAQSRHLAIAADAELRRRRPGQRIEALRSAEPSLATNAERHHRDLIPQQRSGRPAQLGDLGAKLRTFRVVMNEHQWLALRTDLTRCPPVRHALRDPILQSPQPQIIPSAQVLHLAAENDSQPNFEAVD